MFSPLICTEVFLATLPIYYFLFHKDINMNMFYFLNFSHLHSNNSRCLKGDKLLLLPGCAPIVLRLLCLSRSSWENTFLSAKTVYHWNIVDYTYQNQGKFIWDYLLYGTIYFRRLQWVTTLQCNVTIATKWKTTNRVRERLEAFHVRFRRRIEGIGWTERNTNDQVLREEL